MKLFLWSFLFFVIFLTNIPVFAFEINDLKQCQSIAIKQMSLSDTPHRKNSTATEFYGNKSLQDFFGDNKVYFETEYIYKSDFSEIILNGDATWYHIPQPYNKNKKRYRLRYQKNDVMLASAPADILTICRKENQQIIMLITKSGSDTEAELFELLNIKKPNAESNPTLWQRLWNTESKQTEDYELEEESLPLPAIPEKSWVRVYFTPGTDCENNIITEINNAKKIDIAVYSITNQNIVDAIIEAKERGAKIRVITDRLQSKGKYSLVDELSDAGIPVITNVGHKIMHNKFAIFDGKRIESGSYNWTESASKSNAENCTFFEQENKTFSKQFEYLWGLYQK